MKKHFFLFRHGETTYNLNGYIQGQTNNSVLTEKGTKQAFDIGVRLSKWPIQVLLCSPLKRAQQTAEQVLKSITVPLITEPRFTEVNVGELEGMYYKDAEEKFAEKYKKWRSLEAQYQDVSFKGGESKRQVKERIFSGLEYYATQTEYEYMAVSAHGILLTQTLLRLGESLHDVPNGHIMHIVYENKIWRKENDV